MHLLDDSLKRRFIRINFHFEGGFSQRKVHLCPQGCSRPQSP